ncbi:MAG: tRNA-dihydrouridine synthase, partial [Nanoarchaeota archaeon]|nr:tRNA-dihydrouridine synthase [Nanoarchaeota archaeon]
MVSVKKLIKKNPFVLSPMDDVTDIAFRELACENGASYSVSELTSVDAFVRGKIFKSRYERGKLKVNSVQFFGSNPDTFVKAANIVGDEADIIDINFGCP